MISIIFLLSIIFITLGISVFLKNSFSRKEGFVEGLTLSQDEITLLKLTGEYQISDLSLCVSAIYQIQPLVTNKNDLNQAYINKIIIDHFNAPATALYYIINPSTASNATTTAPKEYKVPDNVEEIITKIQPLRTQLCSSFIKSINSTVPNLTTKQGNQEPSDQILSIQLESYQKKSLNGAPPLPGTPSTSATSPPNDIVVFITGHYFAST